MGSPPENGLGASVLKSNAPLVSCSASVGRNPYTIFTVDLPGLIRGEAWIMAPDLPEGRPWGNGLGLWSCLLQACSGKAVPGELATAVSHGDFRLNGSELFLRRKYFLTFTAGKAGLPGDW